MHVAIVGGGIFGQVIAWRLAVRGHCSTVIEPFGPGNARSQSGDRSRIVRAFSDHPALIDSGRVALELWARWSAELGVRLIEPVGVVYLCAGGAAASGARQAWIDGAIARTRAAGVALEELTGHEAARYWPALSPEAVAFALFEAGGGFGRPSRAARAIARAGLATGRVAHIAASAERVLVVGGTARGVAVRAQAGGEALELAADAVVIAAGYDGAALISPFTGDLGIRRVVNWGTYWDVPYPGGAAHSMDRLPVWADLESPLYGFPDDGENGVKIAWHDARGGRSTDTEPSGATLAALRGSAARFFRDLERASCRNLVPCAYDSTPDEMFRIGPVPGVPALYFAGGFSGHGFKHAPSLGDSVAALVAGEDPETSLAPYRLTPAC